MILKNTLAALDMIQIITFKGNNSIIIIIFIIFTIFFHQLPYFNSLN